MLLNGTLLLLSSSLLLNADITQEHIPNVVEIVQEGENFYSVQCANGASASISKEETNICIFSKENDKNRCDHESNWTVVEAASFACQ